MDTFDMSMPWADAKYAMDLDGEKILVMSTKSNGMQKAEWLAIQVTEHNHLLWVLVGKVARSKLGRNILCDCPRLSAARGIWTWHMNRGDISRPRASHYCRMVEIWITTQLKRRDIFPIKPRDPSKGREAQEPVLFAPPLAEEEPMAAQLRGEACRTSFLLMNRVYAHLYWAHFNDTFVELEIENTLNKSYAHFLITGARLDLLKPSDLEPLRPMIDVWAEEGVFPEKSDIYKMVQEYPAGSVPSLF